MAKGTEDLLPVGTKEIIKEFIAKLENRFRISRVVIDGDIKFNGCEITKGPTEPRRHMYVHVIIFRVHTIFTIYEGTKQVSR